MTPESAARGSLKGNLWFVLEKTSRLTLKVKVTADLIDKVSSFDAWTKRPLPVSYGHQEKNNIQADEFKVKNRFTIM